jgi:hypothetical protein
LVLGWGVGMMTIYRFRGYGDGDDDNLSVWGMGGWG